MKRSMTITAILLTLSSSVALRAQNNQPTTPALTRIGFVNTLEVLYGTEEGKAGIAEVEKYLTQQQESLQTQEAELQKLKENFANQQRQLNLETRSEMQRTIEEKERNLKRFQEDTQHEINRRRDELLKKMSDKIQKVINDYAQQNNFAAIFLRDQSQTYIHPTLDITQEIIRLYNAQQTGGSASPSAQ